MIQAIMTSSEMKKRLTYSFLTILLVLTILPTWQPISPTSNPIQETESQKDFQIFGIENNNVPPIDLKLLKQTQETDPELYFPTFLFYSIEIANILIQNLYDNLR